MGVEEVGPEEEGALLLLGQPGPNGGHGGLGAPLPLVHLAHWEGLVEAVEPLVDIEPRSEGRSANEGRGSVAGPLELLREGVNLAPQLEAVAGHPGGLWVEAGDHGDVGRQGVVAHRGRPRESDGAAGEDVDVGGPGPFVAVATQVVRPQGIDRDEHEVGGRWGGARRPESQEQETKAPHAQQQGSSEVGQGERFNESPTISAQLEGLGPRSRGRPARDRAEPV